MKSLKAPSSLEIVELPQMLDDPFHVGLNTPGGEMPGNAVAYQPTLRRPKTPKYTPGIFRIFVVFFSFFTLSPREPD